jgi:hypothetical protein
VALDRQLNGAGIIAIDDAGHGRWQITDADRRLLG